MSLSLPTQAPAGPTLAEILARRRERFLEGVGEEGAALILAAPERRRSNDSLYDYRPSNDLLYLTGFEEPESAALFLPGHPEHPFVAFVRRRDPAREVWDGARLGVEAACGRLGAQRAHPIDELYARLPELLVDRRRLVYALGEDEEADREVVRCVRKARWLARRGRAAPLAILDPRELLHEQRLLKAPEEIAALRRACQVSAEGHLRGMRCTRPGMREYELQAEIEYHFKQAGARAPGYTTIVGAGANACVLHYVDNRAPLRDGDLVLVDAGAEVQWYTGDVTRTWPVNGRFTGYQRTVYDLVLRAQMDVIREVRPGLPWPELHRRAVRTLTEGLVDLGVIEGPVERALEQKTYARYYMHGTGHWLGMDVHDVGAYARRGEEGRPLEPGMVFTVEPGLYFPPDDADCPEPWRGIGVRIEDDVLVTADGCEVLTAAAPKEPEEIEEIVGRPA